MNKNKTPIKKRSPLVYIVVAIHNRVDSTKKFITSLKHSTYKNYRLVIVDDGSSDNSAEIIRKIDPNIEILQGDGSLWWTKATNIGIQHAIENGATYVLILNNDNLIDKNLIKTLTTSANENKNALLSSKVFAQNNKTLFFGGGHIHPIKNYPFCDMTPFGNVDNAQYQVSREIDCGIGMGLLIPAVVFKKIGYLNENRYPQYYSDFEFTRRAKKEGYKLIFCPKAILFNNTETTWRITRNPFQTVFHKGSLFYFPAIAFYTWDYYPRKFFLLYIGIYTIKVALTFLGNLYRR